MSTPLHSLSPLRHRPTLGRVGPRPVAPEALSGSEEPREEFRWSQVALAGLGLAGVVGGLAGCSPPTAQVQLQEMPAETFLSTANEVELGRHVAEALEKQTPLWHNPEAQARLQRIGQQLAAQSSRTDVEFQFKLLDTEAVNAMALPGGTIYATRGLMEKFSDDGELAFVVGHEFAHIEQRHPVEKFSHVLLRGALTAPLRLRQWPMARWALQAGDQLIENRYGQAAETEADRIGQQHLVNMGLDPMTAVRAMERLQSLHSEEHVPASLEKIFSDHPPTRDRIENLRRWAQHDTQPQPGRVR